VLHWREETRWVLSFDHQEEFVTLLHLSCSRMKLQNLAASRVLLHTLPSTKYPLVSFSFSFSFPSKITSPHHFLLLFFNLLFLPFIFSYCHSSPNSF
jgi:hypothetical protein